MNNYIKLEFLADSRNEHLARTVISCFCLQLNPTLSELSDIKTAVSEAVTNCVVHAYSNAGGRIVMQAEIEGQTLHITITDFGKGIADIDKALEPFYTTMPDDERSGMGFTIMQTFMSDFTLSSTEGGGTVVKMKKIIGDKENCLKENA